MVWACPKLKTFCKTLEPRLERKSGAVHTQSFLSRSGINLLKQDEWHHGLDWQSWNLVVSMASLTRTEISEGLFEGALLPAVSDSSFWQILQYRHPFAPRLTMSISVGTGSAVLAGEKRSSLCQSKKMRVRFLWFRSFKLMHRMKFRTTSVPRLS